MFFGATEHRFMLLNLSGSSQLPPIYLSWSVRALKAVKDGRVRHMPTRAPGPTATNA